jgi:4-hydroxybenzoate polyprenyltransferase
VLGKLKTTLEMIKFEHTIFALPFAFMGAFFAAQGLPDPAKIGWILLAMVSARSAAMAFNRLVDYEYDSKNPRTISRALPKRTISRRYVAGFVIGSSVLFLFAAAMLNTLAFTLSPFALAIVLLYSFAKRYTWLTHFFLGLALACAPVGAWIAIQGSIGAVPLLLGLIVVLWVAGFDIIYACQDVDFDRREELHSIPARFGIPAALWISALLHLSMVALIGYIIWLSRLDGLSLAGLAVVTALLAYEHSVVRPSDMSRVNTAFFTINGWISVLLFATTGIDILWH